MFVQYSPSEIQELIEAGNRPKIPIKTGVAISSKKIDPTKIDLKALAKTCPAKKFHEGAVLFKEGDDDRTAFLIVQGKIEVVAYGDAVKTLKAGDLTGEMSLIDGLPRSETATCITEVIALTITEDTLQSVVLSEPLIAYRLLQSLSENIRSLHQQIYILRSSANKLSEDDDLFVGDCDVDIQELSFDDE